jgi:hypothetical protein
MCSAAIFPTHNFEDQKLQDLASTSAILDILTITSFFGGENGAFVFSWLPDSDPSCKSLIRSLDRIPDADLANAITRYLFESSENVHIKPDWWEQRPTDVQNALINRMFPLTDQSGPYLVDDGVEYFSNWNVLGRRMLGLKL